MSDTAGVDVGYCLTNLGGHATDFVFGCAGIQQGDTMRRRNELTEIILSVVPIHRVGEKVASFD